MLVKEVEVVHEASAQPGPVAIRWAQCPQRLRLVKRAASAYEHGSLANAPMTVIARLDWAIQ